MKTSLLITILAAMGCLTVGSIATACVAISKANQVQTIKGENGKDGQNGKDGVSVTKIEKTSTEGNVDTYTIIYSNGKNSTFTVTNGKDGAQGIQGEKGKDGQDGEDGKDGHSPIVSVSTDGFWVIDGKKTDTKAVGVDGDTPYVGENGNWFVGTTDTGVKAQGEKGKKGDTGADGADGKDGVTPHIGDNGNWFIGDTDTGVFAGYSETYTVTFNSDGGTEVPSQTVRWGNKVEKPSNVTKEGFKLLGWYIDDEKWNFSGFSVTEDITLKAKWDNSDQFLYTINDSSNEKFVTINSYIGKNKDVVIPSHIQVYGEEIPVTTIEDDFLNVNETIVSVTIPTTITKIGGGVLQNCKNLENIYYQGDLVDWLSVNQKSGFFSNYNLYCSNKLITDVVIPTSVTSLPRNAFLGCKSLTSIKIPNTVTSIGDWCFSSCPNLKKYIIIPSSVTYVGQSIVDGESSIDIFLEAPGIPSEWSSIWIQNFKGHVYVKSDNIPTTSPTDPKISGFWHYVDGNPIVW